MGAAHSYGGSICGGSGASMACLLCLDCTPPIRTLSRYEPLVTVHHMCAPAVAAEYWRECRRSSFCPIPFHPISFPPLPYSHLQLFPVPFHVMPFQKVSLHTVVVHKLELSLCLVQVNMGLLCTPPLCRGHSPQPVAWSSLQSSSSILRRNDAGPHDLLVCLNNNYEAR